MKKKAYFDVMRIVAIFLVLMNHQPAYKLYYSEGGVAEVFALLEAVIIRVNVPLFAMISGALLLGREETLNQLWKKRISRFLWVIVIFSALLYLELGWLRNRDISLRPFVYGLVADNLKSLTSYWFLYAYLGFLLMLPFLRRVARGMTKDEFWWLMGIHILFSTIIPLINLALCAFGYPRLHTADSMSVALSSVQLFFYPLIGYYIDCHVDVRKITLRQWIIMGAVCMAATAITAAAVYADGKMSGFSERYINFFNYINVISLYLVIKKLFSDGFATSHVQVSGILSFLASLTFGIYLLDLAVQLPIYKDMKDSMMPVIGKFPFSIAWCLTSFVIGGTITWILKHIPFIKKLI